MKKILSSQSCISIAFVLLSLAYPSLLRSEEAIDYPIRGIDPASDKFSKVYSEVTFALEMAKAKSRARSRVKVIQNIAEGAYLVSIGKKNYVMMRHGGILTDDTELDLVVTDTGEVYQYTSVLGAKKTVGIIKEAEDSLMSREEFISRLKAGESFTLPLKVGERGCKKCYGRGKTGGGLSGPPARVCTICDGGKKIPITKTFRIQW